MIVVLALVSFAARTAPPAYTAPVPPVVAEPRWENPAPGSMIRPVVARRMVGQDGFSRQPGDVVTVRLVEETVTQMDASTEASGSSDVAAKVGSLFGLEGALSLGGTGDLGVAASRSSSFSGEGSTGRGSRVESVVSCTITEVIMPMMDYRIWCSKQVTVNRETQWVVLTGRIRARDIRADNSIPSNLVAHAAIEVTGRGVVADKQRPGVLMRVLDALWPF